MPPILAQLAGLRGEAAAAAATYAAQAREVAPHFGDNLDILRQRAALFHAHATTSRAMREGIETRATVAIQTANQGANQLTDLGNQLMDQAADLAALAANEPAGSPERDDYTAQARELHNEAAQAIREAREVATAADETLQAVKSAAAAHRELIQAGQKLAAAMAANGDKPGSDLVSRMVQELAAAFGVALGATAGAALALVAAAAGLAIIIRELRKPRRRR